MTMADRLVHIEDGELISRPAEQHIAHSDHA
jgi:hypothetical protein